MVVELNCRCYCQPSIYKHSMVDLRNIELYCSVSMTYFFSNGYITSIRFHLFPVLTCGISFLISYMFISYWDFFNCPQLYELTFFVMVYLDLTHTRPCSWYVVTSIGTCIYTLSHDSNNCDSAFFYCIPCLKH